MKNDYAKRARTGKPEAIAAVTYLNEPYPGYILRIHVKRDANFIRCFSCDHSGVDMFK